MPEKIIENLRNQPRTSHKQITDEVLKYILENRGKKPVKEVCKELSISPTLYYRILRRNGYRIRDLLPKEDLEGGDVQSGNTTGTTEAERLKAEVDSHTKRLAHLCSAEWRPQGLRGSSGGAEGILVDSRGRSGGTSRGESRSTGGEYELEGRELESTPSGAEPSSGLTSTPRWPLIAVKRTKS